MKNKGFVLSPAARWDLIEIAEYIAADSPVAAEKLIVDIEHACESLASNPRLGHARKDLTPDPEVRFYCVREYYLVIYRTKIKALEIARVLHGARDIASELSDE